MILFWNGTSAAAHEKSTRPNVLLILVDDLGYGDLSSYGAPDLKSPQIDQLLNRGMKFTEFYANCPVCSPTRAALLTGRYQDLVGVPGVIRTNPENSWGYFLPSATTLANVFQQVGYHTGIIGKWHLGLESPNTPNERGFESFQGFLGDMMDDYYHHRRHNVNYMRFNQKTIEPQGHATDLFTDWTCEFLQQQATATKPFFLYLAYNAPHTPIQPPEAWVKKVVQREPGIRPARAKLVALIEHLDAGIGKIMQTLDKTGLSENTVIVFTSDNGGQLSAGANNGNLRDGKQSVYEGGLKVPAGVVWKNRITPQSQTDFMAMSMDLFPTLCEAAGITVPGGLDAVSFLPTLEGKPQSALRENWFFRRREGGNQYGGKTIEALRSGDWKLLQNSPFAPLELYNLKQDPLETKNLAAIDRKKFHEMSALLRAEIQRYGRVPWQKSVTGASE
tara:strand:+ start:4914 stop:6254 length:1341 start_codon:yes stop_codon:yes gene_type:complete